MIDLSTAERFHNILINKYGGSKGIRDEGSLLAGLARPYASFDQQDLYPTAAEKATAIFESIIINHPFMDGNKRIAFVLMRLTLLDGNLDILASEDEKYDMTIAASTGSIRFDEIKDWIASHLISVEP
ncbi:type II toxin-antitoxin system death-on-curing family toxin [Mucilaginibacter sp. L3T2-6]|uniref:type II toxin-antitoxin system death-on-curing family toxin n=1 Tax=Mucilaginibacter sp. L3T2-6 TaxID=3062491 RepID=UPI0026775ED5|nr:type II toxin-antitoxin system death-on-curing family toxin [Mucilaginibacter sp. L3T2-6]MDO3642730.1 type II toxin-antitoxin system death-on-curing family toxin [Mucilaginibacter sp. L3T2-6]MDV6215379.1 type II toxin-antitoxin system death-on-curing family toxin [Mucilaginibacter sp. L3T2-6]